MSRPTKPTTTNGPSERRASGPDSAEATSAATTQRTQNGTASHLASAAAGVALMIGLSRIAGFVRVLTQSFVLGGSAVNDAYNIANTTPNQVYDLVVGGILSATIVPIFVEQLRNTEVSTDKRRGRTRDEGWAGVSAVCTTMTTLLLAVSLLLAVAAPLVVRLFTLRAGARSQLQAEVMGDLLRWFAPQVALYGIATLAMAVLNALNRFALALATSLANNAVVVAMFWLFPGRGSELSLASLHEHGSWITWLGLGTTLGVAAYAGLLLPLLRRANAHIYWNWDLHHPAVRRVLKLSGWTLGWVVANQVAVNAMLVLANWREGDPTAYSNGYTFFQLPFAVVSTAVMTALQPELTRRWLDTRLHAFTDLVRKGATTILAFVLPAAAGFVALARPAVELLLAHGEFSAQSARVTADVVAILALGLPGFSLFRFLVRAWQATQQARRIFIVYLIQNALNVALGVLWVRHWHVQGLAASITVSYTIGALLAAHEVRRVARRRRRLLDGGVRRTALRGVLLATATGAAASVAVRWLDPATNTERLGALVVIGGLGATVYLTLAVALGLLQVPSVRTLLRSRAQR